MKGQQKIWMTILAIIGIGIYGNYFFKNQEEIAHENYLSKEKNVVAKLTREAEQKSSEVSLFSASMNDNTVLLHIPKTTNQENIVAIEENMKIIANELTTENKNSIIAIKSKKTDYQQNIQKFNYYSDVYSWSTRQKNWIKKTIPFKQETLVSTITEQALNLGDIFQNQKNLLIASRMIQKQLLKDSSKPKENVEHILNLPLLNVKQTEFKLEKDKITLSYPDNPLNLSTFTLHFKEKKVGELLNEQYVKKKYVQTMEKKPINPNKKYIALTFDDGPNGKSTEKVLDILKNKNVQATFFVLGQQAETYPSIVKKIHDNGHEIGNHSYSHPDLVSLSEVEIREQIVKTEAAVYRASGTLTNHVRPPYGSVDPKTAITIGLPITNWSIDSLDWKSKNAKKIHEQVLTTINNHGILLMHDIQEATAEALPAIIDDLKKEGYEFVTVSKLLNKQTDPLTIYYDGFRQKILE